MKANEANESIDKIVTRIRGTLTQKGGEYKESVISVLPRSDWLSQIVIKANRAQRATNEDKLKDELLDTACYCILLLDKIDHDGVTTTSLDQAKLDMYSTMRGEK